MFENMNVLIVESLALDHDECERLSQLLQANHALKVDIKTDKSKKSIKNVSSYTHVIANSVSFPDYGNFESLMIPIVTSQWLDACEELQKLVPLRPYNPDPKYFFKSLVITVSDLPQGDREMIYGGVRLLGGQYSDQLLLTTTHLIAVDGTDDLCCVARECNETGESDIKIVSPRWIDDCFKLRRKLNESKYLLDAVEGDQELVLSDLDVRKSHTDYDVISEDFLKDIKFYIGKDLQLSAETQQTIETMLTNSGGIIVKSLDDATLYVGKYRDGDEYLTASRNGINVGNLNWIYYMILNQIWVIPTLKLLHYPYVRGGLPGFDKFVIGVTNYTGDGRFYLENLISAMGGVFTKNLKMLNTHLICAKPVGKKYELLKQWQLLNGIKVVNHLWLEESYRKWKILDEEFPKYGHLPKNVNLGEILGGTSLDESVLRQFWRDNDGGEVVCDSLNELSELGDKRVGIEDDKLVKRMKLGNEGTEEKVEKEDRKEKVEKEEELEEKDEQKEEKKEEIEDKEEDKENIADKVDTVKKVILAEKSHPKRNAKLKAAIKLHSDMEDLNVYQNQTHTRSKINYQIQCIVTGCENDIELNEENLDKLSNLGISVVQDFDKIDNSGKLVLVAPRILRTEKFLSALLLSLDYILIPKFLTTAILNPETRLKLDEFTIQDALDYTDLKLQEIWSEPQLFKIDKLIEQRTPVFQDLQIVIFSTALDLLKNSLYLRIIQRHGCKDCKIVQKMNELDTVSDTAKILSKKKLGKKYTRQVVDYDWVVQKIMLEIE